MEEKEKEVRAGEGLGPTSKGREGCGRRGER